MVSLKHLGVRALSFNDHMGYNHCQRGTDLFQIPYLTDYRILEIARAQEFSSGLGVEIYPPFIRS